MSAPRYVAPGRLKTVRWTGRGSYRVLSYYFTARWNWPIAGSYVSQLLQGFAVPQEPEEEIDRRTPGSPPSYSLMDTGSDGKRRYRMLHGDYELVASRDPRDVLNFLAWHIHCESARRTGDFLLVHAGAAVSPAGDGLLLPGGSGSGKTSLVAGLVREGFGYLSDEVGVIDPVTRELHPHPRSLALKPGMFRPFVDIRAAQDPSLPKTTTWYVRPDEIRSGAVADRCRVGLVVFPRHREGAPTRVAPMSPAEATVEAARNTMNLSLYRGRGVLLLAEVVGGARSFRLESGDLEEAVAAVRELAGAADPTATVGRPPRRERASRG